MSPITAVIFDLDGTLIDSERCTVLAYVAAGKELGLPVTEDLMHSLIGLDARTSERLVIEALGSQDAWLRLRDCGRRIREAYGLELKPGAQIMLEYLLEVKVPCAIATSTRAAYVEIILDKLSLRKYIKTFVGGDQVSRGKPDPEIYLSAAAALGRSAAECLVFEDSEPGMRSALAAGMPVIHVPDLRTLPAEVQNMALSVEASLVSAMPRLKELLRCTAKSS